MNYYVSNVDIVSFGTWRQEVWLRDLYCDNCQRPGGIIATGQILGHSSAVDCTKSNPEPISKPGQILQFPGGEIIE